MRGAAHLSQGEFDVRCEWGLHGVEALAPISDVVVIVDVLSFTTCVDIATANGAAVFPYRFRDGGAGEYARARKALLAGPRSAAAGTYSLSPTGLLDIAAGVRLVLPSPNGSTLSLATGTTPTLAGCLRNSRMVAACAARIGRRIAVVPCGERWPDDSLRPALEDLLGAGAIIIHLAGSKSPEAHAAQVLFESCRTDLAHIVAQCASGQELIRRGYRSDLEHASRLDCSTSAPLLRGECFVDANITVTNPRLGA